MLRINIGKNDVENQTSISRAYGNMSVNVSSRVIALLAHLAYRYQYRRNQNVA